MTDPTAALIEALERMMVAYAAMHHTDTPVYKRAAAALAAARAAPVQRVRVKPLEWDDRASFWARAAAPLFGTIHVSNHGSGFIVCWSVPGYSDTFTDGYWPTVNEAKAAAQSDYDARILAALDLSPSPVAASPLSAALIDRAAVVAKARAVRRGKATG